MEYKDQLVKRVQEELNGYFEWVKKFTPYDIENELFLIKSYVWQRMNQPVLQEQPDE